MSEDGTPFVQGFDSTEEMFAEMEAREARANMALLPFHNEITWGTHAVRFLEFSGRILPIFEKVSTLDELVAGEVQAGADEDEAAYYRRHYQEMHQRGYRRGWCYSYVEPDGEFGDIHLSQLFPITEEEFEEAKAHGWTPSEVMVDRLKRLIRQYQ